MTNCLVTWIGTQALRRTFASIADDVGIVEGTVRLIFKDYVAELEQKITVNTPGGGLVSTFVLVSNSTSLSIVIQEDGSYGLRDRGGITS